MSGGLQKIGASALQSLVAHRRSVPDERINFMRLMFAELQGNWGRQFVEKFSTGEATHDGKDVGVSNAVNVWSRGLAEYPDDVIVAAVRCAADECRFAPGLGEIRDLCKREIARRPAPIVMRERLEQSAQRELSVEEVEAITRDALKALYASSAKSKAKTEAAHNKASGSEVLAMLARGMELLGFCDRAEALRELDARAAAAGLDLERTYVVPRGVEKITLLDAVDAN